MITIQTQSDGVLFNFQDSTRYLYGDGSILTPYNSLTLIADESNVLTFRKSASNDIFITAGYDELGYSSKEEAINDLKTKLFKATGGGGGSESGITSGEVQTMIDDSLRDYYTDDEVDAALSGKADASNVYTITETNYLLNDLSQRKADTSAVTAVASDVSTVSGQVATKVAISDFNAYSAATDARIAEDEEVTAAALNNLDENKQDALEYYSENTSGKTATIHIEDTDGGTVGEVLVDGSSVDMYASMTEEDEDNGSMVVTHSDINGNSAGIAMAYEKNIDDAEATHSYLNVEEGLISMEVMANEETTNVDVTSTGVTINGENVATEPYVDAAVSGKVDTSAITSSITSGSTDSEIPTAKATYDAIQAGGGITVDSAFSRTSENPVQNKVISNSATNGNGAVSNTGGKYKWDFYSVGGVSTNQGFYLDTINGETVIKKHNNTRNLNLIETTAITSAMTSSSTDAQVPSAKAVYDTLGGLKFMQCTQAEYDALVSGGTVDSSTIYFITNVVS